MLNEEKHEHVTSEDIKKAVLTKNIVKLSELNEAAYLCADCNEIWMQSVDELISGDEESIQTISKLNLCRNKDSYNKFFGNL